MSISVTIKINPLENRFDELRRNLLENLKVTVCYEGNQYLRLVEPGQTPRMLLLIQEWESVEAYQAYKNWRKTSGSSALKPEFLATPLEVVFSEILF